MWSAGARRRTATRFPPGSASWSHYIPNPDTWRCGSGRRSSPPRPRTRARAPNRAPAARAGARARARTEPWRYRQSQRITGARNSSTSLPEFKTFSLSHSLVPEQSKGEGARARPLKCETAPCPVSPVPESTSRASLQSCLRGTIRIALVRGLCGLRCVRGAVARVLPGWV